MVIDIIKADNTKHPRYLVYDVVKFEGKDVSQLPFYPDRLKCIQFDVIGTHIYWIFVLRTNVN